MKKVFIDGGAGTTGLRIVERLSGRDDVCLLTIPEEKRKDAATKKQVMNEADVVFLCLPDAAAIESAALVENPNTVVIDASTAHRTLPGWAYGFPELGDSFLKKVQLRQLCSALIKRVKSSMKKNLRLLELRQLSLLLTVAME